MLSIAHKVYEIYFRLGMCDIQTDGQKGGQIHQMQVGGHKHETNTWDIEINNYD